MENDLPVEAAEPTLNPTAVSADAPPVVAEPVTEVAAAPAVKPEPTAAEREAKALQRRVDRLTREKYETRAQLDQLQRQQPAAAPDQAPIERPLSQADVNQRAEQIAEQRLFNQKCDSVVTTGDKAFPDFKEKLEALGAEVPLFSDGNRPTPFLDAVLDADNPAMLLHHLGSNPDIAAELADLSPRQQVRKLALIERDLGEKPKPQSSNAPKPLQPVRSVAAGGGPDASKDPDAWIKWRNAQVSAR